MTWRSRRPSRARAAVALLADTSFSMAMDGRWVPMKRTALALHHLIRTRFRGDHLQLIGFGRNARVMDIEELTALDALWDKGTNLHHACSSPAGTSASTPVPSRSSSS